MNMAMISLQRLQSEDKNDSLECSPRKSSELIFQREKFQVKETSEIRVGRDVIGKKMLNEYRYVRTLANS